MAVIAIDDQSSATIRRWPWSHENLARMIGRPQQAGAKVGYASFFFEPRIDPGLVSVQKLTALYQALSPPRQRNMLQFASVLGEAEDALNSFVAPTSGFWVEKLALVLVALYIILMLPRPTAGLGFAVSVALLIALIATHFQDGDDARHGFLPVTGATVRHQDRPSVGPVLAWRYPVSTLMRQPAF